MLRLGNSVYLLLIQNQMGLLHRASYSRLPANYRSLSNLKPFSEIPGPRSLPLVGTLWQYVPLLGSYKFDRLDLNGALKLQKYGPVVKEEIVPGEPVVWIFEPEDVQELLKREGRFPQRRSHLAIQHLRMNQPDKYNTGGLLPTNGPDWWKLRSSFQKGLSSPISVKSYIPEVNEVLNDFIEFIKKTHDPEKPSDFLEDLSRLFLEILGLVAFGVRLNSFSSRELTEDSRSSQLIRAALEANSCILRTDNGPQLWRYFPTPLYKLLQKAHDTMERFAQDFIRVNKERLKVNLWNNNKSNCLIETYLRNSELDEKDVLGMAVDMILAGVDTTSYTSSFALYHLARHPDQQQKLYQEYKQLLSQRNIIDSSVLSNCHYVKAVLKETLRLNPVSVGVGRVLEEDAVFSGYQVPRKTVVVTQNQVVCRQAKFFEDPNSFKPERWLKSSETYKAVSPYLLLPFGHGARTCIARRLAEQNIQILLLKIINEFTLEWAGKAKLEIRSLLINKPDGPLLLRLRQR